MGRPWSEVQVLFRAASKAADGLSDAINQLVVYNSCADCAWENNAYGMALEHKKKALMVVQELCGTDSDEAEILRKDISSIGTLIGSQN